MTRTAAPEGYHTSETAKRVPGPPDFLSRWRWRAERRARRLNAGRHFDTYRYEVQRVSASPHGRPTRWRWAVVAMQNVAVPDPPAPAKPATPTILDRGL